jgi:hypothetical protein
MKYTISFRAELHHDALKNIVLPFSSFNMRIRSGADTYMNIVVPTLRLAEDINDRLVDGDLYIYKIIDGAETAFPYVHLDNVSSYIGPVNQSMNLTGYRTFTNSSPVTIPVIGVNYTSVEGGKNHVRCSLSNAITPGDTAEYGLLTFIVGLISIAISVGGQLYQELTEE